MSQNAKTHIPNYEYFAKILIRSSTGTLVVKIISAGLMFGLHVLLARMLGIAQYGIYSYVKYID